MAIVITQQNQVLVAPDTFEVSAEPITLIAELHGALAICLHDEGRAIGGLLHLRFLGESGRLSDATDNDLSSVLSKLDRFKRAVLGNGTQRDEVQARIIAHALPPLSTDEPSASLVDLIRADFADDKTVCGSQILRRAEPVGVSFQPATGRIKVSREDEAVLRLR